jgi:uncharacterized repeat protein (TIGR01451 family)
MEQIIPLTLRSDLPRSNFRALTSALCSFAILIMPFAQMAAAARGNQRSELSDQRSKVRDAKNAAPENLLQPNVGSPIIGATLTDNRPSPDPTVANPGDTIHYTAIISNTGTADATGVQFNDDVDANTAVVNGSVKVSPLAFPDNYNGTLNTQLIVAAPGVLTNDTGIPAPTAVPIASGATTQGGTVTLNSDGSFTYTPANNFAGGNDTFTYTATNGQAPNDTATVTIAIPCQTINVTNPANTSGTAGTAFSETFTQSGSIGSATFTTASALPSGFSLSTAGVLSGTTNQLGIFPIVVTVTDSNGCTGTGATYNLTINCQTITVTNPANSTGTAGSPFSETFTQSNAIGSATFTTASTLPTGLSLSSAGVLSGTPTQAGTFPIVVTVTDSNGCTGTGATYNLVISCQTITVTNPANSTGTAGSPFSETFSQTGGVGTITWSESGALPTGITLSTSTGVLSGTTTDTGTFPITVTATDQNGCQGTGATYNLTINPAGPLMFAAGGVLAALDSSSLLSKFMLPLTSSAFAANRGIANASNSVSLSLTENELNAAVAVAIARWSATGLSRKQIATLHQIKFEVADLSSTYLGEADSNRILVSRNAQGKGWFIDAKPSSDLSFAHPVSSTRLYADPWGAPAGHIDLLTAIEHEIGHKLGLNDTYAEKDRGNLMYGYLTVGERRLPSQNQARYARGDRHAGPHFLSLEANEKTRSGSEGSGVKKLIRALNLNLENRNSTTAPLPPSCTTTSTHVCVDVGTLPTGKSVTITFAVTINSPYGGGASVSNQGTVSGGNFSNVSTDDPDTGAANDATVTPICGATTLVTNTNDSGNGSLRQAILNLCPGGTINFDTSGVFATSQTITLTSAELSLDRNLTINGPTGSSLTISGNNARRVLNIQSGKTVLFSNLTIANGIASTGGGILNAGTLTITSSTISNNTTPDGTDATGSTNGGNGGDGGGIYNTGTLTLINSTIGANQTGRGGDAVNGNGGNGGRGAAIFSSGTVQLTNTTITDNESGRYGFVDPNGSGETGVTVTGGIFNSGGTLTLNNTVVANNRDGFDSEDDINGAVNPSSSFNLIGTANGLTGISNGSNGNQIGGSETPLNAKLDPLADNGGPTKTYLPLDGSPLIDAGSNALAKDQNNNDLTTDQRGTGFPRIINSTVEIGSVETVAAPPQAGADLSATKSVDRNTVVPDRDLTYTITVINNGSGTATDATLHDTLPLYTTNSNAASPTFASTTFVSITAPGWSCSQSSGAVDCSKPSFAGNSTQTITLVVHVPSNAVRNDGAPFITNSLNVSASNDTNSENGDASATTELFSCLTDPIVTTNADSGVGSLRQAIADACVGSTITFDMTSGHVVSPITLTSAELLIDKNLTITGPGANLLTVQRSTAIGTPIFRVFNIGSATVTISGLTIANGNTADGAAGSSNPGVNGGGIINTGTLSIANSSITGNLTGSGGSNGSGTGGPGGDGGGIYNSGTLTITNSTVSGNRAGHGGNGAGSGTGGKGGSGGGIANTGTLTVLNSTLSGNQAGSGGNAGSSGTGGAGGDGGAILSDTGTITNCTISGNLAGDGGTAGDNGAASSGRGGGLYTGAEEAVANLKNSIIAGNSSPTGPDINGTVNSQDYNLIGNTSGATFTGTTTHNIVNTSANLGVLANNGGPTQTMLPLPGSPAINAGDSGASLPPDTFDLDNDGNTAEALPVDQRGFTRVIGGNFDIGAVESNYAISATAGTPQSATINSAFATALQATVTESGNPQNGVSVTFTAPASGASGAFPGPSATAVASTDSSGVATAPTFTANGIGGSYNVVASIGTSLPTALFALTNNKASTATAVSASPNPSNLNQSVTFTATVTSAFGTPTGTVQFKDGGASIGSPQALNGSGVATFATSSLSAGVHTITADYSGDAGFLTSTGTLAGGQQVGSIIRFSASNYNTTEGSGSTTITVQRIGDLSQAVTVDYTTPDDSSAMTVLPCSTANGVASSRCDFEVSLGTLRWAAGDGASKTFTVLINQDNFVEGAETLTLTLSNLTGGAGFPVP